MNDDFWRHLDPLVDGGEVTLPGTYGREPTTIPLDDPDAQERLRSYLEHEFDAAREARHDERERQRDRYRRASEPGYFEAVLDEFAGEELHPMRRAELIAIALLERRLLALEGLVLDLIPRLA